MECLKNIKHGNSEMPFTKILKIIFKETNFTADVFKKIFNLSREAFFTNTV